MSLIAYYKFDEATATDTAADEQGSYDLTPDASAPTVATGRFGNCRKWTADGQYLQSATYPPEFASAVGEWTLAFWLAVYDESVLSSSTLFSVRRQTTGSHHLARIYLTNAGTKIYQVGFLWNYAAGSQESWSPNIGSIQAAGVWNHHAIARSGNSLNWYINGTLVESKTMTNSVLAEAYTYVMSLGRGAYDASPSNLNGVSVDDFRIYDAALTAAEVETIAEGGASGSSSASPGAGNVLQICSDAAAELGLGELSTVYANTNANVVQLRNLLKSVGRKLAMRREWPALNKEHAFDTVNGTASYDLPIDFSRMVDQTQWNRDQTRSLRPIGAQRWQQIQGNGITSTVALLFRPRSTTVELSPTPTAAEEIAFEYQSRYWLQSANAAEADKDAPTADTDTVLFDPSLMVAALKLAWLKAKGMDATAALSDYEEALQLAESTSVAAAPVLNLLGAGESVHLIDESNVPEGDWDIS